MTTERQTKRSTRVRKRWFVLVVSLAFFGCIGYFHMKAMRIIRQAEEKWGVSDDSLMDYMMHSVIFSSIRNITSIMNDSKSSASSIGVEIPIVQDILPQPPQLKEVIDEDGKGWNVIKDVRWLIDFSIIGFAKTGTTTLLHYLKTDDIWTTSMEKCDLGWNRPAPLIRYFYTYAPIFNATNESNHRIIRGMKCPTDIESMELSLPLYGKHFNTTKFIIGVRHPVRWFESLYNFRLSFHTHGSGVKINMKQPRDLMGGCFYGSFNVCSERAMFDIYMATLGKTALNDEELSVMNLSKKGPRFRNSFMRNKDRYDPLPNKIFLYDMNQLADVNETRSRQFREDLRDYLGSKTELPPMMRISTKGNKQNITKINICDDEHKEIRSHLVDIGTKASRWIVDYFIKSPDVFVSSPTFFQDLLKSWKADPCS